MKKELFKCHLVLIWRFSWITDSLFKNKIVSSIYGIIQEYEAYDYYNHGDTFRLVNVMTTDEETDSLMKFVKSYSLVDNMLIEEKDVSNFESELTGWKLIEEQYSSGCRSVGFTHVKKLINRIIKKRPIFFNELMQFKGEDTIDQISKYDGFFTSYRIDDSLSGHHRISFFSDSVSISVEIFCSNDLEYIPSELEHSDTGRIILHINSVDYEPDQKECHLELSSVYVDSVFDKHIFSVYNEISNNCQHFIQRLCQGLGIRSCFVPLTDGLFKFSRNKN